MRQTLLVLIALALLATNRSNGQADTTLHELSLKDLLDVKVTTASKTLQELNVAPASVMVISREQIRSRGYQSLLDLIYDLPAWKIDDKMYSGSRNSVTVRGIQGQQNICILLDGVKISSPTNEALPIMENYPVHLAEQVEVVYGPASALYGADAVSGVINIITRKVPSSKRLVLDASSAAGMYGYTNSTLYLAKRVAEKADVVVAAQYCYDQQPDYSKLYSGDSQFSVAHYKAGGVFNTAYGPMTTAAPVTPKYEAPISGGSLYAALHINEFTFSAFANYTTTPSGWGANTANTIYNKDAFITQSVTTVSANYKKTIGRFTSTSAISTASYDLDPHSNYRNLYTGMNRVYKYSNSLSAKEEQQLEYKASAKVDVMGGISFEHFVSVPQSADLEQPVDGKKAVQGSYAGTTAFYNPSGLAAQFYNIHYHNVGSYLQLQYLLGRKLNFTLGCRYDHNSRYTQTWNPRLGMVFTPTQRTTIKALFGSAYLAPPPSTAYVVYGSFVTADSGKTYSSSFLHLPNPGLGPVRSRTTELAIRQYFTDNIVANLNGFYTYTTGQFAFADDNTSTHLYNNTFHGIPVGYIEVFVNGAEQRNYGTTVQLDVRHSLGNAFLNSHISGTFTDGYRFENTSGAATAYRTGLPFVSNFMGRLWTDIHAGKFTCSPRLTIMGRQNLPATADTSGNQIRLQTIKGYLLLNASLRYQANRHFAVFANVSNALDQRYRNVGFGMDLQDPNTTAFNGQPQEPIRVSGGLNVTF